MKATQIENELPKWMQATITLIVGAIGAFLAIAFLDLLPNQHSAEYEYLEWKAAQNAE